MSHVESELGTKFNGNGHVPNATHRGWLRKRLRDLLECFPTIDGARTWVMAACFKAQRQGEQPMAYFAQLVKDAGHDEALRDVRRLLSAEDFEAFLARTALGESPLRRRDGRAQ